MKWLARLVACLFALLVSALVLAPASPAAAEDTTYDDAVCAYDTVLLVARLDSSMVAGRTSRAGTHVALAGHSVRDSQVSVAANTGSVSPKVDPSFQSPGPAEAALASRISLAHRTRLLEAQPGDESSSQTSRAG